MYAISALGIPEEVQILQKSASGGKETLWAERLLLTGLFLFWCNLQRGHAVSSEWEINIVLWCKDDVFRDFLSLCGMAKQIKKEGSSILWNKICYSTFFHHITLSHTESVSLVCSLDPFFFYFHSYRVPYQITSLSKFAQCSILVMSKFALLYWFSSVLAITNYTVPT